MRNICWVILLLLNINLMAQEIEIGGTLFKVTKSETSIECENFSIKAEASKLPSHLHHSQIPKGLSIGHVGGNYIGHKLHYISQSVSTKVVGIKQQLKGYEKLDKKRVYIAKPVKFLLNNHVLISLYGGGNCNTVCEAYASLEFNKQGELVNAQGAHLSRV